jgi:hypothetical protein
VELVSGPWYVFRDVEGVQCPFWGDHLLLSVKHTVKYEYFNDDFVME